MRSVVVVFPASMWAMMPMFRVRSRGTSRAMLRHAWALPAVVGEGLVRLRHAMRVLLLLDGTAAPVGGVEQLARELGGHGLLRPRPRVLHQPAHGERRPPRGADLDRDLVGGAADATGPYLHDRLRLIEGALEHRERVLLGSLRHHLERAIEDALHQAALPVVHHGAHELRDRPVPVLRVRQDVLPLDFTFAWHARAPSALGSHARDDPRCARPEPAGFYLGLFAPYFERPWRRSWTPIESSVPRMMW